MKWTLEREKDCLYLQLDGLFYKKAVVVAFKQPWEPFKTHGSGKIPDIKEQENSIIFSLHIRKPLIYIFVNKYYLCT